MLFSGVVTIKDNVEIGSGSEIHGVSTIHDGAHLIGRVFVASGCEVHSGARINDGSILGDFNVIGPGAILGQRVKTDSLCKIYGSAYDDVQLGYSVNIARGAVIKTGVHLEDGVCVEENVVVTERVRARMKVTAYGVAGALTGDVKYVLSNGYCVEAPAHG